MLLLPQRPVSTSLNRCVDGTMAPVSGFFCTLLNVFRFVSFHSSPRVLWPLQHGGACCPPQPVGECCVALGGLRLVTFAPKSLVCFMQSAAELHLCHLAFKVLSVPCRYH